MMDAHYSLEINLLFSVKIQSRRKQWDMSPVMYTEEKPAVTPFLTLYAPIGETATFDPAVYSWIFIFRVIILHPSFWV